MATMKLFFANNPSMSTCPVWVRIESLGQSLGNSKKLYSSQQIQYANDDTILNCKKVQNKMSIGKLRSFYIYFLIYKKQRLKTKRLK